MPNESNYDVVKTPYASSLLSLESDPICGSGGCETTLPAPPKSHPVDYPVPNFGVDKDILDNHKSLEDAEKQRGHHW